jgi:hypothetical protein
MRRYSFTAEVYRGHGDAEQWEGSVEAAAMHVAMSRAAKQTLRAATKPWKVKAARVTYLRISLKEDPA